MQKNSASLAQLDTTDMRKVLRLLGTVADAAALSSADQQKVVAFIQAQQGSDAGDEELGAPDAAAYESQSSGILDVLEDLKEKAETQLAELRKAEVNAKQNYEMLKQSLEDQNVADTKDLEDEKSSKAANEEAKAEAEGDLKVTIKELDGAQKSLKMATKNCMQQASDHEATLRARREELKVIAKATKILQETASGKAFMLLQTAAASTSSSRAKTVRSKIAALVKRLARQYHSAALAQLASRINTLTRFAAASGGDPFAKVKGLIQNLIAQLEEEAESQASEKAYCDAELAKTAAKTTELDDSLSKLAAKIDQAMASSADLKEEIKELQGELAAIAKSQSKMDKVRQTEHEAYVQAKTDLEQGASGVRQALEVLRDYYASDEETAASMVQDSAKFGTFMQQQHAKAEGAGATIIGILEVVESDFATSLVKEEAEESDAQSEYDKITQENKLATTSKAQDVEYKTQAVKALEKNVAEQTADRDTSSTERAAVLEYDAKLKERCVAKPESYEERKKRREAEISGLKEALATLRDETTFMQRKGRGGNIRGSMAGF